MKSGQQPERSTSVPFGSSQACGVEKAMAPTPVCLPGKPHGRRSLPAVHGVTMSQTRLSDFTFTFHFHALEKSCCLENPRDRGAWWAAVHGVAQSQTPLKRLSSSSILSSWRRKWQPTPVFCRENPREGGAWWAAVYGVAQSRT